MIFAASAGGMAANCLRNSAQLCCQTSGERAVRKDSMRSGIRRACGAAGRLCCPEAGSAAPDRLFRQQSVPTPAISEKTQSRQTTALRLFVSIANSLPIPILEEIGDGVVEAGQQMLAIKEGTRTNQFALG